MPRCLSACELSGIILVGPSCLRRCLNAHLVFLYKADSVNLHLFIQLHLRAHNPFVASHYPLFILRRLPSCPSSDPRHYPQRQIMSTHRSLLSQLPRRLTFRDRSNLTGGPRSGERVGSEQIAFRRRTLRNVGTLGCSVKWRQIREEGRKAIDLAAAFPGALVVSNGVLRRLVRIWLYLMMVLSASSYSCSASSTSRVRGSPHSHGPADGFTPETPFGFSSGSSFASSLLDHSFSLHRELGCGDSAHLIKFRSVSMLTFASSGKMR